MAMQRQNFAYKNLEQIPGDIAEKSGRFVEELDLTNNKISDLRFLIEYTSLHTLVLDHNEINSHVKMPDLPRLHTLWLNHNKITNLGIFMSNLSKKCPNLRILSMMNNKAAPSYFNDGTYQEYLDYRYHVISSLPKLEVLDDRRINESERAEAERIFRPIRKKSQKPKKTLPAE